MSSAELVAVARIVPSDASDLAQAAQEEDLEETTRTRLEEILKKVAELVLDQPWQLFWQVSNGPQCLCNKAVVVVKAGQPDLGLSALAVRLGG